MHIMIVRRSDDPKKNGLKTGVGKDGRTWFKITGVVRDTAGLEAFASGWIPEQVHAAVEAAYEKGSASVEMHDARFQSRPYEAKDGAKRYGLELVSARITNITPGATGVALDT